MEKKLGVAQAREQFSDLVEQVQYLGATYIIARNGKPAAAIVPIEVYESWKRERNAFFETIRRTQERSGLSPEAAEQLAAEAIASSRKK
jgi:prevent-host-death family protein